ncbi:restriction endonuclease [Leptospira meyeri]|uniref:nSTAND3 domain-containing NTPase n=1 Tax=Leptospira meyeri TaxID=29508 RepID=UPI0002BE97A7|nr:restriction endonuclease [Leptospira meyeri]EMJ90282.1 restriction endonuclease domain protein [Leptospira meyeri serovar Semaranga str. Veldrot Semarang 173]
MNYKFEVFDDKEFELFVRDILQTELGITLQTFKSGKDKGIDCRYSGAQNNEIIIQAKRYSNFNNLIKSAEEELLKITKIDPAPKRYIFATSMDLNPMQLDALSKKLSPLLKTPDDIYYASKLNNILSKPNNYDIERKYYKLWITSTNVLNKILHNSTSNNSEFNANKIIRSSSLYVYNNKYLDKAIEILNREKFLVITGPPGIGKTSLSYILAYQYLAKEFKLIYVDSSIFEAESVFSLNSDIKQIVLFDDFLGSFIPDILSSNKEKKLVSFIEKVKNSNNKYMIMTSRTVFYNEALQVFEKLNRSNINLAKYELDISHYSNYEKAKILYKHLSFSGMLPDYKNEFLKNKNYLKVIKHRNYTPRIIEYFTNPKNSQSIPLNSFIESVVLANLEDPKELWKFHYETQIDDECRIFVDTVFMLGLNPEHNLVEVAYKRRLDYEKSKRNITTKYNSFFRTIKTLQEGFIRTSRSIFEPSVLNYNLLNPSLGDFLINYFNNQEEGDLRLSLFYSIVSFDQVQQRFHSSDKRFINITEKEYIYLLEYLISNIDILKQNRDKFSSIELEIILYSDRVFSLSILDAKLEILLEGLKINEISDFQIYRFLVLIECNENKLINDFIRKNWDEFIIKALGMFADSDEFSIIKSIFTNLSINFDQYFSVSDRKEMFDESMALYLQRRLKDRIQEGDILDGSDDSRSSMLDTLGYKLDFMIEDLCAEIAYSDYGSYLEYIDSNDLEEYVDDFIDSLKDHSENIHINQVEDDILFEDEDSQIDDLFSDLFAE